MLRPWPYETTGRAWGYAQARQAFIQNMLEWDELGATVLRLYHERVSAGAVVSVEYARYVRGRSALAWPRRGQGNRAMRRMSALYGVECGDE